MLWGTQNLLGPLLCPLLLFLLSVTLLVCFLQSMPVTLTQPESLVQSHMLVIIKTLICFLFIHTTTTKQFFFAECRLLKIRRLRGSISKKTNWMHSCQSENIHRPPMGSSPPLYQYQCFKRSWCHFCNLL